MGDQSIGAAGSSAGVVNSYAADQKNDPVFASVGAVKRKVALFEAKANPQILKEDSDLLKVPQKAITDRKVVLTPVKQNHLAPSDKTASQSENSVAKRVLLYENMKPSGDHMQVRPTQKEKSHLAGKHTYQNTELSKHEKAELKKEKQSVAVPDKPQSAAKTSDDGSYERLDLVSKEEAKADGYQYPRETAPSTDEDSVPADSGELKEPENQYESLDHFQEALEDHYGRLKHGSKEQIAPAKEGLYDTVDLGGAKEAKQSDAYDALNLGSRSVNSSTGEYGRLKREAAQAPKAEDTEYSTLNHGLRQQPVDEGGYGKLNHGHRDLGRPSNPDYSQLEPAYSEIADSAQAPDDADPVYDEVGPGVPWAARPPNPAAQAASGQGGSAVSEDGYSQLGPSSDDKTEPKTLTGYAALQQRVNNLDGEVSELIDSLKQKKSKLSVLSPLKRRKLNKQIRALEKLLSDPTGPLSKAKNLLLSKVENNSLGASDRVQLQGHFRQLNQDLKLAWLETGDTNASATAKSLKVPVDYRQNN